MCARVWTEAVPLLVREQSLVIQGLEVICPAAPGCSDYAPGALSSRQSVPPESVGWHAMRSAQLERNVVVELRCGDHFHSELYKPLAGLVELALERADLGRGLGRCKGRSASAW